jgi:hypothetical protein
MIVRGRITSLAALSVLGFAVAAGSAHAEPGLTVDPDSPAGVEYAVPLDSARGHGGHGGGGAPGGGSAPATGGNSPALFGSGIKAAGGSGSDSGSGSSSRGSDKGSGDGGSGGKSDHPAGGSSGADTHSSSRSSVAPVTASADYSTTGPVAALIGGILLVGGGFGLLAHLRSRRKASDSTLP